MFLVNLMSNGLNQNIFAIFHHSNSVIKNVPIRISNNLNILKGRRFLMNFEDFSRQKYGLER